MTTTIKMAEVLAHSFSSPLPFLVTLGIKPRVLNT